MAIDQYGRFIPGAPSPRIEIPRRQTPDYSSSGGYRSSWYGNLWSRFDYFVSSIGNFIATKGYDAAEWIAGVSIWIYAIGLAIWVIGKCLSDGLLLAVLYGIGAVIMFGIGSLCISIVSGILQLLIGAIRCIFWNGWSLLAFLGVAAYLFFARPHSAKPRNSHVSQTTEVSVPAYNTYRCTARVLNVRSLPDSTSPILGKLHKGDEVEVTDKENGFAAIEYNGRRGYASLKYLNKIN